jgi:hypothetical protein
VQDALVADDEQRRGDGPGPACRTGCCHCFAHQLALATLTSRISRTSPSTTDCN